MNSKRLSVHAALMSTVLACGAALAPSAAWSAPTCPLNSVTNAAKGNKLFLYFPTSDDSTFPAYDAFVSPAKTFDVADLDPNIGTTAQLRSRIHDIVVDDYCEFNVQVLATTSNPDSLMMPPARRNTVAIGTDNPEEGWGLAQAVDIGDNIDVDYARVWAGQYLTCEGGNKATPGCSSTGSLNGANSTLDRWANAIGGTAAHEAGHTYGLQHFDDNPNPGICTSAGPAPKPGEDSYERHLMPSGCNLNGEDRAGYRRHISDRTFGILAKNVGLTIETMHNWDLINPNPQAAHSLEIEFLSQQPSVTIDWVWEGSSSPWVEPVVTGPLGTTTFKGETYNRYRITWSAPNPGWSGPTPGVLPGGADFHIGATFTGVDFNQPEPIIIQNLRLFDASSNPLTLHPRLPGYDAGEVDGSDGSFDLNFFANGTGSMVLQEAVVLQLPRVAAMESLIGDGRPFTFDGMPIEPWSVTRCEPGTLRDALRCTVGNIKDRPHVEVIRKLGEPGVVDCSRGIPRHERRAADSAFEPDYEGPICAGTSRDPFPSATVYVIATFVDPEARHWDPERQRMVVGPVTTKVFYQFAGVRDLTRLVRTSTAGR